MTVAIVTDSACDLAPSVAGLLGIAVVPLKVRFGSDEYVDGLELSNEQFWAMSATSDALPSTAAPSPGEFATAFRNAAERGADEVVCITLSQQLSATHQSAVIASHDVADAIEVKVVDSSFCTVAQATLCREAARLAADGATGQEVVSAVESLRGRTRLYGTLDTLDNLRKGGRIGRSGAFFGALLSVKPVITIRDGEVQPESRPRTRRRALDWLVDAASKQPVDHVAVAHAGAPDLEPFLDALAEATGGERAEIDVADVGPVIGAHGGLRLVAVSFALISL